MKILVAIKDRRNNWMDPFVQTNEQIATRTLAAMIKNKNPENLIANFPEDFEMWKIAEYDEEKGIVNPIEPVSIAKAGQLTEK